MDDLCPSLTLSFRLPGVIRPGIYDLYLEMFDTTVKVGEIAYRLQNQEGLRLPNYPPMQIGAAVTRDSQLFVGVKAGQAPTESNRFLMPSGLEIYDITIADSPVRLAQLETDFPVTGLALLDDTAYLAAGEDGLVVVDVADLENPLRVNDYPVPGQRATDVAIDPATRILAMSVANDLGTGFVRFFSLDDSELEPPYGAIAFNSGDLLGQPVDVQWQGQSLFVLLNTEGSLRILRFDDLGGARSYSIFEVDRELPGDISAASFVVQYDQIVISTGREYLVMQADGAGGYQTIYWQDSAADYDYSEIFSNDGSLFLGTPTGADIVASADLALTDTRPASGARIGRSDVIRLQFNQLINTDGALLGQSIRLLDETQQPLDPATYNLEGINTLQGGFVNPILNSLMGKPLV